MANLTGNILITAAALGYLTAFYPGAASATDLKDAMNPMQVLLAQVVQNQKTSQLRSLGNDLMTSRVQLCMAEKTDNFSAKQFAELRFSQLYAEYQHQSNGVMWRVPDCTELN